MELTNIIGAPHNIIHINYNTFWTLQPIWVPKKIRLSSSPQLSIGARLTCRWQSFDWIITNSFHNSIYFAAIDVYYYFIRKYLFHTQCGIIHHQNAINARTLKKKGLFSHILYYHHHYKQIEIKSYQIEREMPLSSSYIIIDTKLIRFKQILWNGNQWLIRIGQFVHTWHSTCLL